MWEGRYEGRHSELPESFETRPWTALSLLTNASTELEPKNLATEAA